MSMNLYKIANALEKRAEDENSEGGVMKRLLKYVGGSSLLGSGVSKTFNYGVIPLLKSDPETSQKLLDHALKTKAIEGVGKIDGLGRFLTGPGFFSSLKASAEQAVKNGKDPKGVISRLKETLGLGDDIKDTFIALHDVAKSKPGIVAHEVGHALDQAGGTNLASPFRLAMKNAQGLGILAPAIAATAGASDKTLGILGGIGALTHIPTLRDEFVASKNGYKLLRGMGKGRLKALTAFTGVPAYLASAALPFAPLGIRKLTQKLKKNE